MCTFHIIKAHSYKLHVDLSGKVQIFHEIEKKEEIFILSQKRGFKSDIPVDFYL